MRNELGSGLGEGFMMQSRQQREEYRAKKGKTPSPVADPLTKLRDSYYADGDCTRVSALLLKSVATYLTSRLQAVAKRKPTKVVRLQVQLLKTWQRIVDDEKKRRGLR